MLIRVLIICSPFLLSVNSFSQNLLVNGGLEDENICTEYSVNCAPEGWITNRDGFSNYFKDVNRAHGGEHYLAVEAGNTGKSFQRTFIRSRLVCGLRKDHRYKLEFYIKSPHDILDSIGVLFTPFDFLFGQKKLQNITPSLFIRPAGESFIKDSSWQKVSMDYLAKGDEAFMAVANFSRHDIRGETNIRMEKHFFVFLDDISLTPLDPHERLCPEWKTNKQEIYDQDERHEFLRQKIRQNMSNPLAVVIPSTRFVTIDTLILPDVFFATGKSELRKEGYLMLDSICIKLRSKNIDSIVVEGHTDITGSFQMNEKLAEERAWSVEDAIRQRLVLPESTIITGGWGGRKPAAVNSTAAGRQLNRRVEIFVYLRE